MVQDERKKIFPECMVSFILVNNSISIQYTDYLIYTNNSDDVNAETLQSSEKGHMVPGMTNSENKGVDQLHNFRAVDLRLVLPTPVFS